MYDIGVALRRFKPLIRWTAWRSSRNPLLKQTFEDLEAEGLLVLVECCRSFPEGQTRFARYFKRAWYNRLKRMYRDAITGKRQGQEVDLEKAEALPIANPKHQTDDFLERMKTRFGEISPYLSDDAKRLLTTLLDPPQGVFEYAYRDFCRKNKLVSLGQRVSGANKFRIRLRHIRKYLKMPSSRVRELVVEVKSVNRKLSIGG